MMKIPFRIIRCAVPTALINPGPLIPRIKIRGYNMNASLRLFNSNLNDNFGNILRSCCCRKGVASIHLVATGFNLLI